MKALALLLLLVPVTASAALDRLVLERNAYVGGDPINGMVVLDANANFATTVTLTDNTGSVNTPPNTVVEPGTMFAKFTCTSTAVSAVATRSITATQGGQSRTVLFQLHPMPKLVSMNLSATELVGGMEGFLGRAWLDGPAPKDGVFIALTDNSSAINMGQAHAFISAGGDGTVFSGNTEPVSAVAVRQVSASLNGVTKTVNVTLHPRPTISSLSLSHAIVQGGFNTFLYVNLEGRIPAGGARADLVENSSVVTPDTNFWWIKAGDWFTLNTSAVTTHTLVNVNVTVGTSTKSIQVLITP